MHTRNYNNQIFSSGFLIFLGFFFEASTLRFLLILLTDFSTAAKIKRLLNQRRQQRSGRRREREREKQSERQVRKREQFRQRERADAALFALSLPLCAVAAQSFFP